MGHSEKIEREKGKPKWEKDRRSLGEGISRNNKMLLRSCGKEDSKKLYEGGWFALQGKNEGENFPLQREREGGRR